MESSNRYDYCRTMQQRHQKNHLARLLASVLLLLLNGYLHTIMLSNSCMLGWNALANLFLAIMSFVVSFGVLFLGLLAKPERLALTIAVCATFLLGIFMQLFSWIWGGGCLLIWITQLIDCKNARWLMNQPGYPQFNERFEEEMKNYGRAYKPDHKLDGISDAVMSDIGDTKQAAVIFHKPADHPLDAPQAAYAIVPGEQPYEMPDIVTENLDIFSEAPQGARIQLPESRKPKPESRKRSEQVKLPDLPDVNDIPSPTWDVPDPASDVPDISWNVPDPASDVPDVSWNVPDPASDVPDVSWNVPDPAADDTGFSGIPEIAGDIPDLPDIPDIPQI